jgi:hypothetical protein
MVRLVLLRHYILLHLIDLDAHGVEGLQLVVVVDLPEYFLLLLLDLIDLVLELVHVLVAGLRVLGLGV